MDRVSLKQIAVNIGVSERLVAYALNGTGRVGSETRLRIVDEAQRLGYRPNRAARALATGRSGLLALCLPQMATAYGDAITRIVEARARTSDFDLVVTRMAGPEATGAASLVPAGLAQVDGAFLLEPPRLPSGPEMSTIRNAVVIGVCGEAGLAAFDHVRVDLHAAARYAVRSLLDRSPSRFAYMTATDIGLSPGEARYSAYLEGARSATLEPIVITLQRNQDLMSDAAEALLKCAGHNACPDAIMCSNDEIAIGVLRALRRLELSVPGQVAVTGCDGIAFAEDICPPLSTIAQPFGAMLDRAWEFLMLRLADPAREVQHSVIEARFVRRESSG